ncbi:MAG: DUF4430 domain-containing protein [Actinomycetota bacterium]|nr:DUF4430 domain-containing protein [Actinomycetota bacterium]
MTQDFGARPVGSADERQVPGSETAMRALQRSFRVDTRYGGGYVQSIDGHAGTSAQRDWFYYVNGIQAPQGAATTAVHQGDHIWFDLHDWHATDSIPAVVGAFPEPFRDGVNGKRYPTTIECASDVNPACKRVASELSAAGIPTASQLLGTGSGQATLGVVVAPWREVAGAVGGTLIAHGPSASGIYARFAQGGARLQLLGPSGAVARTLGAGAGLVAATADSQSAPTWLITGTDARGVAAAAAALTPQALHNHFALAVSGARRIPVPVGTG